MADPSPLYRKAPKGQNNETVNGTVNFDDEITNLFVSISCWSANTQFVGWSPDSRHISVIYDDPCCAVMSPLLGSFLLHSHCPTKLMGALSNTPIKNITGRLPIYPTLWWTSQWQDLGYLKDPPCNYMPQLNIHRKINIGLNLAI